MYLFSGNKEDCVPGRRYAPMCLLSVDVKQTFINKYINTPSSHVKHPDQGPNIIHKSYHSIKGPTLPKSQPMQSYGQPYEFKMAPKSVPLALLYIFMNVYLLQNRSSTCLSTTLWYTVYHLKHNFFLLATASHKLWYVIGTWWSTHSGWYLLFFHKTQCKLASNIPGLKVSTYWDWKRFLEGI